MSKPCRLELNNSGSWKLLGKFDAAVADSTDDILNAAAALVDALNAAGGRSSLRISTDDAIPCVLMRYERREDGWRKKDGAGVAMPDGTKNG